MKLTLDALEVLDAIERKGTFSGAAEALFRVPSTVTYTVQKLEEDLGFSIFKREGRRSVLTPAGRVLLEQGRILLRAAEGVVESAHQVNSGWESQIHIAVDTVWDIAELYPIVAEFHQLNSGVQVNISEEVMGGSLEAIVENRVDIVVGGPPPVNPIQGVHFEHIKDAHWQFVVTSDHPLVQCPQPLSEADIKPYLSVVVRDSSNDSPIMSHRVFDKQPTLRVANIHQKIQAQLQGVGIGFLPTHKIHKYLEAGLLIPLAIDKEAPVTPQFCSWRTGGKGKAMKWFVDKIIQKATHVD